MKFPSIPQRGDDILQKVVEILTYLRASRIIGINGTPPRETPNGTSFVLKVGGTAPPSFPDACPFGEIITWTEGEGEEAVTKTAIRGGVVHCGDKNFLVPPLELDLETDGVSLIYLEIECESNRDDDGEIFLPGIKTSSVTDAVSLWNSAVWTEGASYPDNFNPEVSDGIGFIVVPIAKLTILDVAATLEPEDCGNVTIGQCAGVLSYTRG